LQKSITKKKTMQTGRRRTWGCCPLRKEWGESRVKGGQGDRKKLDEWGNRDVFLGTGEKVHPKEKVGPNTEYILTTQRGGGESQGKGRVGPGNRRGKFLQTEDPNRRF